MKVEEANAFFSVPALLSLGPPLRSSATDYFSSSFAAYLFLDFLPLGISLTFVNPEITSLILAAKSNSSSTFSYIEKSNRESSTNWALLFVTFILFYLACCFGFFWSFFTSLLSLWTLILQEFSSREYTYILCVDLDSTFFFEIARRPEMFTKS